MRKISYPEHYTEDTFYNANLTNLRQTNTPLQGEMEVETFWKARKMMAQARESQ